MFFGIFAESYHALQMSHPAETEEDNLMTDDREMNESQSLGEYLRKQRTQKGLELSEVAAETKIPLHSLQAMEDDDYSALPANAFARGFYSLYAKFLLLDSQEIVARYERERDKTPKRKFPTPGKQEKQVNTMAARPTLAIGSAFGFFLVLFIALAALLCWYFSWNPATFLSEKLRSLQYPARQELQQDDSITIPSTPPQTTVAHQNKAKYVVTAEFASDAAVTISVDDSFPKQEHFIENSTHSWYANDTLTLVLPESVPVQLYLNGSSLDLPDPQDGFRTLKLP